MATKFAEKVLVFFRNVGEVTNAEYVKSILPGTEELVLLSYLNTYKTIAQVSKTYQIQQEHNTLTTRAMNIVISKCAEINNFFTPLDFPLSEIWITLNDYNKAQIITMMNQLHGFALKCATEVDLTEAAEKLKFFKKSCDQMSTHLVDTTQIDIAKIKTSVEDLQIDATSKRVAMVCVNDIAETIACNNGRMPIEKIAAQFQTRIEKGEIGVADVYNLISQIMTQTREDEDVD